MPQTLAQTLTAGNVSGGTAIQMQGANFDLGSGTGTGGGTFNADGGTINLQGGLITLSGGVLEAGGGAILLQEGTLQFDGVANATSDGSGNLNCQAASVSLNGAIINLSQGAGSGGTTLNLDGAIVALGSNPGGTPTNPATPAAYWQILAGSTVAYVPVYV